MTNAQLVDLIKNIGIIVAISVSVAGAYYGVTRDRREARSAAVIEAEKTIALLEKQNSLLLAQLEEAKRQGDAREAEWKKREADWKKREDKLETRVHDLERDYRNLVLTVTTMGFCVNANTGCKDYNPGDRRTRVAAEDLKPGGTD